jgi:predicted O-linked N-acetylglucosamine transferase (SPINDLY family)
MIDPAIQSILLAAVERHRAGDLVNAEAGYRQVLQRVPNHADALHMLGLIEVARGQHLQAVELIRKAIQYRPDNPEACFNLGVALEASGETEQAQAAWTRAVQQRPTYAGAHFLLGQSYHRQWKMDAAIVSFNRVIELDPRNLTAYVQLASAYREKRRIDEAIATLRQVLAIDPNNADAWSGLGVAFSDQGMLDDAMAAHRKSMQLGPQVPGFHSNLCYCMHYHPASDAAGILREHQAFNTHFAEPLRESIQAHTNDPAPGRKLRIGYLSPDFRVHPVGRFMLPMLMKHNRQAFEAHCYSTAQVTDSQSDAIQAAVDFWHDCAKMNDRQIADQVRADGIDVLTELSLHSAHNRLLVMARKPAPVQVTWLGYASTTGLPAIDYRLSDRFLDPPGTGDDIYTEKTIHLPTYWCYPAPDEAPAVADPPSLKQGFVTFGSLNNFVKINDTVLALWIELLTRVERSRLLLHSKPGAHWKSTLGRFETAGIDPRRIAFIGASSMGNYLRQYQNIDIALDTTPYAGGTTTCDALYMGVPVVTLRGQLAVGRMGAALLSHLDAGELIAETPDAYVAIATELAANQPRLIEYRRTLRRRMIDSPLMNPAAFTSGIEEAFRIMWRAYCQGR